MADNHDISMSKKLTDTFSISKTMEDTGISETITDLEELMSSSSQKDEEHTIQQLDVSFIDLENGERIKIIDKSFFNQGGQGQLYRVMYEGKTCVLKWFKSKSAIKDPDFKKNLSRLTSLKIDGFLLPKALTVDHNGSYGYVMDYVSSDSDYVLLSSLMYDDNVGYKTDNAEYMTPYTIANSFKELHSRGECFKDINDNNIFVNLKRPDIKICDCDNIAPGDYRSTVRGKPGYIAPEVFLKKNSPDIYSDQFSLAVLFFRMFIGVDPFLGRANKGTLDDQKTRDIYANNPIFIFDETDHSNEYVDVSAKERWDTLSKSIKDCFKKTFTNGLKDKKQRTSSDEWTKTLYEWGENKLSEVSDGAPEQRQYKAKKRFQPIFFVIDNSSSMEKYNRLEQIQKAFNKLFVDKLMTVSDTTVSIDLMLFSKKTQWVLNELTDVSKMHDIELKLGEEHTNFNLACKELDERLNKDRVLNNQDHPNVPVIILLSDGSDPRAKYEDEINLLSDNRWFKKAHKLAIGISVPEDKRNMLLDFVNGDAGFVRNIDDGLDLCEYIKAVTMTITQTATQEDYDSVRAKIRELVV